MDCKKCNRQIPDDAMFCPYCGTRQTAEPRKHRKRANGTGTIYKRQGNLERPWIAKKNNIYIGSYKTRTEAQRALERLTDTDVSARYNMTFSQVYALWLPEHEREITQEAKTVYEWAYGHCRILHDKKFRSLRTSDFQRVIIDMEKLGLSKSSCEKVMQLFGQLSAWAMREDVIQKDYSKFVSTVATQKTEGVVLKQKTIRAIQKSQNPAADIVLVLLGTGCRPGELFNARVENCHDSYFIGGSKTATGRNRVIPVAKVGQKAYKKLLTAAIASGSDLLIGGYNGNREYRNFAKREFKELVQEVGEKFSPYDCRHTFATQAQRSGVDPQTLRRMLGHASVSTTDKYYTHLDTDDLLQEAALIKIG
jgi:integrase